MIDYIAPSYLHDSIRITRLARVLKGAPEAMLDHADARRLAYEQAGALHGIHAEDYDRLDKGAVASERIRAKVFAEATD